MDGKRWVALLGARGLVGRQLMTTLLEQGYRVKLLIRNTHNAEIDDENVEVHKGDARDAAAVKQLLRGCCAVINTVGMGNKQRPHFCDITKLILGSLAEAKIERYITVSVAALELPGDKKNIQGKLSAFMTKFQNPAMMEDKADELKILMDSSALWTLVRLPQVLDDLQEHPIKASVDTLSGSTIGNGDIARFLVGQIEDRQYLRKVLFISN